MYIYIYIYMHVLVHVHKHNALPLSGAPEAAVARAQGRLPERLAVAVAFPDTEGAGYCYD